MSWEMLGPAALHPDPDKIRGGRPTITQDDVRLALGGLGRRPFLFGMAAFLGHRGSLDMIELLLTHDLVRHAMIGRWGAGKNRRGECTGELTTEEVAIVERMASLMLFEVISARSRNDTYAHEEALPSGSATVLCPACRGRGARARIPSSSQIELAKANVKDAAELCQQARACNAQKATRRVLACRWKEARRDLYELRTSADDHDCGLCAGRGRFLLANPKRAQMVGITLRTWERKWSARYAEGIAIPQSWESIAVGHVRRRLHRGG